MCKHGERDCVKVPGGCWLPRLWARQHRQPVPFRVDKFCRKKQQSHFFSWGEESWDGNAVSLFIIRILWVFIHWHWGRFEVMICVAFDIRGSWVSYWVLLLSLRHTHTRTQKERKSLDHFHLWNMDPSSNYPLELWNALCKLLWLLHVSD